MAQGRVGVGVALLFAFAGSVSAQPAFPNTAGGIVPVSAPAPATFPAATGEPPLSVPHGAALGTMAVGTPYAPPGGGAVTGDHASMRELPSGLPDLIPAPEGHHHYGPHHIHGHNGHGCEACGHEPEIPGYLSPFLPEHGHWFFTGEYLLMRPRYTDFDYAIVNADPGLATNGPIRSLKYGLGSGFRTELAYRWGESPWETAFAYTYFTSNSDETLAAAANQVLLPTLTRPGLTDRALVALANADLDYQLFDMFAARRVLLDDHFAVRAIGGFRFTDIRQTFNALYDGLDARGAQVNTRSRFQGFGPIVGAEGVLVGHKGVHLYARAIGGLIAGSSDNRVIETNDNGQTTYVNAVNDVRKVVPMASIAIGGGWQYRAISIRAGYEVTHWQGIFERPRFVDDVSQGKVLNRQGNLTLEGLFIQVGLSF